MNKRTRPPGPKGLPILGNLPAFMKNPTDFLLDNSRRYGDIVYFELMGVPNYLLNDPEDIKEAVITHWDKFIKTRTMEAMTRIWGHSMLTGNGLLHRNHRAAVAPAMNPGHLAHFAPFSIEFSEQTCADWEDGEVVDVSLAMHVLSMRIVSKILFDADMERDAERFHHSLSEIFAYARFFILPISKWIQHLNVPLKRRYARAKADLNLMLDGMLRDHRARPGRKDVLSMLLETGMEDKKIMDELITLFAAGHETVASSLTWTWYLLSKNPEVEAKMFEELKAVLGDRPMTAKDVDNLPYTRMIFQESMRLYPPIWSLNHRVEIEHTFKGYKIPVGAFLGMSQYAVHHDPRWFPDPFKFDPLRWTQEERVKRPKLSYFPFGAGPRACIGEGLAWFEAVIALATIGRKVRFELARPEPVGFQTGVLTLKPEGGMKLRVKRKN